MREGDWKNHTDWDDPKNRLHCSAEECSASVPNHFWGHVKAEDWFFQKDGIQWCPEHIPECLPGGPRRRLRRPQRKDRSTGHWSFARRATGLPEACR